MITIKSYIWPTIKELAETIWGVVSQILLGLLLSAIVIGIACWLRWWSVIPFGLAILSYYVYCEARLAYRMDKDDVERDISNTLEHLSRLPCYWATESEDDKIYQWYKDATADFIKKMEDYEKKYGKDSFYQDRYADWETADRYLRDSMENKTF